MMPVEHVRLAAFAALGKQQRWWTWLALYGMLCWWAWIEGGLSALAAIATLTTVFPLVNSLSLLSELMEAAEAGTPAEAAARCARCTNLLFRDWCGTALEFFWAVALLLALPPPAANTERSMWRFVIALVTGVGFVWETIQHWAFVPCLVGPEVLVFWRCVSRVRWGARALVRRVNSARGGGGGGASANDGGGSGGLTPRKSSTPPPSRDEPAPEGALVWPSRSLDPTRLPKLLPQLRVVAVVRAATHGVVFTLFLLFLGVAIATAAVGHVLGRSVDKPSAGGQPELLAHDKQPEGPHGHGHHHAHHHGHHHHEETEHHVHV